MALSGQRWVGRVSALTAGLAAFGLVVATAVWAEASSSTPEADEVARFVGTVPRDPAPRGPAAAPAARPSASAPAALPTVRPTPILVPRPVRPLPRIVSRPDGLYVSTTGAPFVARGANYVRLAKNAAGNVFHSTFEPGRYDRAKVAAFLDQMRHDGYNTVRVFIDHGSGGGDHGIGRGIGTHDKVYGPYMDNVAAFVLAAAARGIYTMPSVDGFPVNSYYWDMVGGEGGGNPKNMDGQNLSYMERGRVLAKAEYMANFATALAARIGVAHRTAILAYESDNEAHFETHKAPFNKATGVVTPFNGVTYDMADPVQRQQAADASLAEYTIRVKKSLAGVDPDALLAMGFFSYQAVGKRGPDGFAIRCESTCEGGGKYWYPGRAGILSHWGAVDLIDVHMYENHGAPVLDSLEMQHRKDPYIIGEFGALKAYPAYNNDIFKAATAMRDLQKEGCALGAKGYLYFTWDTTEPLASLDQFFHMSDHNGAINGVLAPIVRPDPCR
jgi:hypothetical protein